MLTGVLLTESLRLGADIKVPHLMLTRLRYLDNSSSTVEGQPSCWTFIDFSAPDEVADELAEQLSRALKHQGGWYADFRVDDEHVVVFADKIFRYGKDDQESRARAVAYGLSVGVPEHQLNWQG